MITYFMLLSVLMVAVMVYDVTNFIIPNWINLAVLLLFPLLVWLGPTQVNWVASVYGFLLFFVIGFGIYLLGLMGGGDIKLLIASSVWFGWSVHLTYFIVYMAMVGGVLAIVLMVARPLATAFVTQKSLPRVLIKGQPVPYGVAIALSFLYLLWTGHLVGLATSSLPF